MQHTMNRLQLLLCGLAIAICFAPAVPMLAQDPGPPPDDMGAPLDFAAETPSINVDKQLERMTKRYRLSDTEKAQILPILKDVKEKMDAVFKDTSLEPEERSAKIKSIHDDEVARISAVMTDDQRAKYQKDEARMQEEPGPDGPPPPPPGGDGEGGPPPPGGPN